MNNFIPSRGAGTRGQRRGTLPAKLRKLNAGDFVTIRHKGNANSKRAHIYAAARSIGIPVATRIWTKGRLRVYRLPDTPSNTLVGDKADE